MVRQDWPARVCAMPASANRISNDVRAREETTSGEVVVLAKGDVTDKNRRSRLKGKDVVVRYIHLPPSHSNRRTTHSRRIHTHDDSGARKEKEEVEIGYYVVQFSSPWCTYTSLPLTPTEGQPMYTPNMEGSTHTTILTHNNGGPHSPHASPVSTQPTKWRAESRAQKRLPGASCLVY